MPTATPTTPPRLKGMVAVSKRSGIDLLGYVVWFSVPDEDLKVSRLRSHWIKAGLDPKPLPPAQKSVNAFKRACRAQAGVVRNEQDGTVTETDVRDLLETSDQVVYQVSRVVRDLNNQVVNYPKAITVWFWKRHADPKLVETFDFKPLGEVPTKDAYAIMDDITAAFDAAEETVPGSKVRTLVRHYIKDQPDDQQVGMSGENLRGKAGGVYFVFAKHEHELERLSNMLWKLYPAKPGERSGEGRAYLHMLPMADSATERELIARHHRMNSINDLAEIVSDNADLMRGDRKRAIRDNVLKHHIDKLARMRLRAQEYAEVLGEEQDDIKRRIAIADKQLQKMIRI